jgi:hypothetical protein
MISFSTIGTGYTSFGVGNILSDPMFVDPDNGDYRLQPGSPCINSGTSSNAPSDDLAGTQRDSNPDMGAYEYNATTVIDHELSTQILTIFPNPSNGIVKISGANDNDAFTVYDLFGSSVASGNFENGSATLDLSEMSNGLYILVSSDNQTRKILKQ